MEKRWHEIWRTEPEVKFSRKVVLSLFLLFGIILPPFLSIYYAWGNSYSRTYGKPFPSILDFLTFLILGIISAIINFAVNLPLLFVPIAALCFIFMLIFLYGIWIIFCHSRPAFIIFKEGVWINWDAKLSQVTQKIKNFYLKLKWNEIIEISYKFSFEGPSGILFRTIKGNFVKKMNERRIPELVRAVESIGQGDKIKNLLKTREKELEKLKKVYPELEKVIKFSFP